MDMVGIEAMNLYAGVARLNVATLARHRGLDMRRFENLLMKEKTVALPYEDPVTFAVNAAKPIIDALAQRERDQIRMVITCTESGFDFSKSMSTYCHDLLGLSRHCRMFEIKGACYSGMAGLQMAVNFVLSQTCPGGKALVLATDVSRFMVEEGSDALSADWSFSEPSGGSGAVAMLVSDQPHVFQIDAGANGYYGFEVMDTCRPASDTDAGNADLSLLSYLSCCENAFLDYRERVADADFATTFEYLAFHTPFGGMVKGAHRTMMRKLAMAKPPAIEADFERRVAPGLADCQRVGNIMGATAALSLASTIRHGDFVEPQRVGVFSYGSGCCSEFFSGVATQEGARHLAALEIGESLDRRYDLTMAQYDALLEHSREIRFGTRNLDSDASFITQARGVHARPTLFLKAIRDFHREYEWVS
ncbi:hydroxymethylglutaryl-CoA synthase family protein [Xanthomonas campestris]|uniref:Hydroxymethylglutaryl-coenzyme A synthase n=1 Tax=Xanthomonas cannabis pv. cannabis TaxID=1885894 RepID=A0A823A3H2_9XANT|nr:3-hydroxy-3-methylglutaryl-ACP synthase [Xanthomonas cannabis pv. cannabis]DAD54491.1 TPA_exp: hydroxymethylglutaryl-coenzyme A synthase [Xanthomonas cannabis pv. cannabis]